MATATLRSRTAANSEGVYSTRNGRRITDGAKASIEAAMESHGSPVATIEVPTSMVTTDVPHLPDTAPGDRKPTVAIMTITPRMAENWLARNAPNNRNARQRLIERYSADMAAGKWRLSDQAISFNTRGELVNGQNRLHSVVKTGVTIQAVVVRNLPVESMIVLDVGAKRNTDDAFKITGHDWPKGCGATVRRILRRSSFDRTATDQEVEEFMMAHGQVVAFAHHVLPRGKFAAASVRAPIVRARIIGKDAARLERFGEVMISGMMNVGDEAAILLRNWVMDQKTRHVRLEQGPFYEMAEAALAKFLKSEVVKRLVPAKDEMFPIASDKK